VGLEVGGQARAGRVALAVDGEGDASGAGLTSHL